MQRFFPVFLMLLLVLSFSGCITQNPESILEERRLRTAVRIHPEHEMGYLRLAQFLENQRRYAETLYVLKQGQQRVPDSLLMVRLEGSLYQSQVKILLELESQVRRVWVNQPLLKPLVKKSLKIITD